MDTKHDVLKGIWVPPQLWYLFSLHIFFFLKMNLRHSYCVDLYLFWNNFVKLKFYQ